MTPYTTTLGKQYKKAQGEAIRAIEETQAIGFNGLTEVSPNIFITTADNERLPHWPYPFVIGENVYVDVRNFYGSTGNIRNQLDYQGAIKRARLVLEWEKNPGRFENVIRPLALVYSNWISSGISSRMNATVEAATAIRLIATALFVAQVLPKADIEELNTMVMRSAGSGSNWIPTENVKLFLESDAWVETVKDKDFSVERLAYLVKNNSGMVLGDFNRMTVLQLMSGGSWLGHDATGIAAIALEYPPYFLYMVDGALQSTMYRNKTRIGRIVSNFSRGKELDLVSNFAATLS